MFWPGSFFLVRACPVHREIFNNIHGLYPLDVSGTPFPVVLIKKCLQILPNVPWVPGVGGTKLPLVENHYKKLQESPGLSELQVHQYRPL